MSSESHFEDIPLELVFEILERSPELIVSLTHADPNVYNFVYGSNKRIFNLLIKNTRKHIRLDFGNLYSTGDVILTGLKDGTWKTYNNENRLTGIDTYRFGRLNGPSMLYDADGNIQYKISYKNGNFDGVFETYKKMENTTVLDSTETYVNNILNGETVFFTYFQNGQSEVKGNFYNGKYIGKWTTTTTLNNFRYIAYTYFYDDGRVVTIPDNFTRSRSLIFDRHIPFPLEGFHANDTFPFVKPIKLIGRNLTYLVNGTYMHMYEVFNCKNGDILKYNIYTRKIKLDNSLRIKKTTYGYTKIYFSRNR